MAITRSSDKSYRDSAMALTKTAPSASTEGQSLKGLTAITLSLAAPSGQTFTGGTMQCYLYDGIVAAWSRLPSADFTVPSGSRYVSFPPVEVLAPRNGRILWASASVTLSGAGTAIDVHQLAFSKALAERY